jgi:hypothetical protein
MAPSNKNAASGRTGRRTQILAHKGYVKRLSQVKRVLQPMHWPPMAGAGQQAR